MGLVNLPGVGAVPFSERPGSPNETFSGDTFRATRTFDVPWYARWAFIRYLIGSAKLQGTSTIVREIPDQYYAFFGGNAQIGNNPKAFMVATTLQGIECLGQQRETLVNPGVGTKLSYCVYDVARITIGYESVTYNIRSDAEVGLGAYNESYLERFVSVFRQPTAEFLTLPFGAFKWVELDDKGKLKVDAKGEPAGIRVTGSNGKIVSASEIILVHHRVPGIPDAIKTHIGCVNSLPWPELGVRKGQLLLTNVEIKPYRWLDTLRLFDITFKFKFFDPDPEWSDNNPTNPAGHNWFLQHFPVTTAVNVQQNLNQILQGVQKYKLITHDGRPTGKTVYEYKDFQDLFGGYERDLQPVI